jgi:hypothetical protein
MYDLLPAYALLTPLNAELNPICHLLALLGGATIVVVSRLRINTGLRCAAVAILKKFFAINPLNAELNPICHLLALLGGATIVVVSRLRVNHEDKVFSIKQVICFSVKHINRKRIFWVLSSEIYP